MATQGGFGIDCQIDVSATLTALAKILDVEFPTLTNYIAEATTHDSAGGFYEAVATGKKRVEPFPVRLAWDTAQATHAAIVTAFDAGTAVTFTIADPAGDETISFETLVENMQRAGTQEGIFECTVQLHPTGQPTIS